MNYLAVSSQGVQRSETRLEYVGNARITSLVGKLPLATELKITVDNAILERDSCDFFASPLLK